MTKPLISIIIPTYNGSAYLAETIHSALKQTYPYFEILVVDNDSKDQTAQIAKSFKEVRYFHLKTPDITQARNYGVMQAKGLLIAFLDHDDIWTPDKLSKQQAFLEENPQVSAVVCKQHLFLEKNHPKPHWLKQEFLKTPQPAYLPSALLMKRSAIEQTNLFDPAFALTSDVAWFFQAKTNGIRVELIPEVLLHRRIHNNNTSHRYIQTQKEILSIVHRSIAERRKKVSVIIAVYNGEKYLKDAIENALAQDYPHKEIIVVNDGSTDSSQKIIDQFGSRIRSIFQKNQGLGSARNTGIRAATGSYFSFLDHDDLWGGKKLSSQIKEMDDTDPLVFSYVQQFVCPSLSSEEKEKLQINKEILPSYFAGNLLISKKRFFQVGFFFERNTVGEFIDWYARAIDAKVPMVMVPQLLLYRRIHNHNMGRQKTFYHRNEYLKILKKSLDRRRSHATSS